MTSDSFEFRCGDCQSTISALVSQAGQEYDCPTCGQRQRIPRLTANVTLVETAAEREARESNLLLDDDLDIDLSPSPSGYKSQPKPAPTPPQEPAEKPCIECGGTSPIFR
jgi:DNA-directed RNA polymerase subunit RPC12/RpoP